MPQGTKFPRSEHGGTPQGIKFPRSEHGGMPQGIKRRKVEVVGTPPGIERRKKMPCGIPTSIIWSFFAFFSLFCARLALNLNLADGPEEREYYAIFVKNDQEIGNPSATVKITAPKSAPEMVNPFCSKSRRGFSSLRLCQRYFCINNSISCGPTAPSLRPFSLPCESIQMMQGKGLIL